MLVFFLRFYVAYSGLRCRAHLPVRADVQDQVQEEVKGSGREGVQVYIQSVHYGPSSK